MSNVQMWVSIALSVMAIVGFMLAVAWQRAESRTINQEADEFRYMFNLLLNEHPPPSPPTGPNTGRKCWG